MLQRSGLKTAAEVLTAVLETATEDVKALKRAPLNDILTDWYLTRTEYEALDEVRKAIGKLLEELSRTTIPEAMAEKDTKTMTVASLQRRFTVSQRLSCSIHEGKKDTAFEYLRANGQGGIIQETINSSTLGSFAKQWIEGMGKELPEEIFKISLSKTTSATAI